MRGYWYDREHPVPWQSTTAGGDSESIMEEFAVSDTSASTAEDTADDDEDTQDDSSPKTGLELGTVKPERLALITHSSTLPDGMSGEILYESL